VEADRAGHHHVRTRAFRGDLRYLPKAPHAAAAD